MCEQKPLVSYLAPCKGVQVQSRILDFTPWIPIHCTRFQSLSVEPGFPAVNNIPDPLTETFGVTISRSLRQGRETIYSSTKSTCIKTTMERPELR